ncbi:type IV toxin-antitoxin system AbiEi family antitoxin domain-containing protein [Haloechinothrix salitolerans]|uniref:Type IV toxin-antitoxin system AbiEi family antitoxin domain-containing protein n=1 Tax=Haloechinothrix salitolerans TaxID=926830 RepID=A0ABW2BZM0_9PSEU
MGTIGEAPFTRADALAAGVSPATIRRRLQDGDWTTLRRGVYVPRAVLAAADTPERRHTLDAAAVLLTLRHHDALVAGTSAARILGLDTLAPPPDDVVIATSDPAKGQRRRGYVLRYADVPPHHRTTKHGVALTSAARTVIDLARSLTLREGVVLADSALRQQLATLPELHTLARDCYTTPGICGAYRAIEHADPKSESVLESLSRVAMREQGLPEPRTQVVICDAYGPIARADFFWERFGVVGEADGIGKYAPDGRRTTAESSARRNVARNESSTPGTRSCDGAGGTRTVLRC